MPACTDGLQLAGRTEHCHPDSSQGQELGQMYCTQQGPEIDGARFGVGVAVACVGVQFNISNPATGCQKVLEIEDERKL